MGGLCETKMTNAEKTVRFKLVKSSYSEAKGEVILGSFIRCADFKIPSKKQKKIKKPEEKLTTVQGGSRDIRKMFLAAQRRGRNKLKSLISSNLLMYSMY